MAVMGLKLPDCCVSIRRPGYDPAYMGHENINGKVRVFLYELADHEPRDDPYGMGNMFAEGYGETFDAALDDLRAR